MNKVWAICFTEQGSGETPQVFFSSLKVAEDSYKSLINERDKHDFLLFEYEVCDQIPEDEIWELDTGKILVK